MNSSINNIITNYKNYSHNFITGLLDLKEKEYFKYFELLGGFYLLNFILFKVNFRKHFLKLRYLFFTDNINKNGWIIFSDGSCDYIVDFCNELLKFNSNFKILLLADEKQEKMLKANLEKIERNYKDSQVFYQIINNEKLINIEEYVNELNNIIPNEEKISLAFLNSDYKIMGFFDKFSDEDISTVINKNISTNFNLLNFVINKNKSSKSKNETLVIYFGNLVSKLKLPYFQLYSSIKLAFSEQLKKLASDNNAYETKINLCYIEDFNNEEISKNIIAIKNLQKGSYFISLKTKFIMIMLNYSTLMTNLYKNIILSKIKEKNKFIY